MPKRLDVEIVSDPTEDEKLDAAYDDWRSCRAHIWDVQFLLAEVHSGSISAGRGLLHTAVERLEQIQFRYRSSRHIDDVFDLPGPLSPAMAAGVTDRLWDVSDIVELLQRSESKKAA